MRIIVGLLRPDSGLVRVAGLDPRGAGVGLRRILGYLPEEAGVYRRMTGLGFLKFNASLYTREPSEAEEIVERGIRFSGLTLADLSRPLSSYSKGMMRRILVARVPMTEPRILVMNEPTAGVDVEHAVAIRRLLREWAHERKAAVLVSSHNMMEMEVVADRVYVIAMGRIVAEGSPSDLKARYNAETLEDVYLRAVGAA